MARVLIIDDEDYIREVLRQILEQAGHQVEEAANGEEGVRLFFARPAELVIVDIVMPGKSGLSTIREVRQSNPRAQILAISGGGKDGRLNFLSTARTFPGVLTLQKPFTRAELLRSVDQLLAARAPEP